MSVCRSTVSVSYPVMCFYDPLDVLIICGDACLDSSFIFLLLDCIDEPFLSSQGKCHDQYCGIGLHYHGNPCMGKWQRQSKGEQDRSDFVRVKFEGLIGKYETRGATNDYFHCRLIC